MKGLTREQEEVLDRVYQRYNDYLETQSKPFEDRMIPTASLIDAQDGIKTYSIARNLMLDAPKLQNLVIALVRIVDELQYEILHCKTQVNNKHVTDD